MGAKVKMERQVSLCDDDEDQDVDGGQGSMIVSVFLCLSSLESWLKMPRGQGCLGWLGGFGFGAKGGMAELEASTARW